MTYPDIELALCELLQPIAGTVTQLSPTLDEGKNINLDYFPKIRISRIGGGEDDDQITDFPRVSIQCLAVPDAAHPRASQDLANTVEQFLRGKQGLFGAGTLIDDITKDSGPVSRFWDDPRVRVTELIYSADVRN